MAVNLLAAGHEITVHNRTRTREESLAAQGASRAETPADAARGAEVVLVCVSDTPDVEHWLFAIIISGADETLNTSSRSTMLESTIMSLDESAYDLRPFMELIESSGFKGPIGFLNFKLAHPEDYLERTISRWNELCLEVGLYNEDE